MSQQMSLKTGRHVMNTPASLVTLWGLGTRMPRLGILFKQITQSPLGQRCFWTCSEVDLEIPWEHNYLNWCAHVGREQGSTKFENADFILHLLRSSCGCPVPAIRTKVLLQSYYSMHIISPLIKGEQQFFPTLHDAVSINILFSNILQKGAQQQCLLDVMGSFNSQGMY